ncbi:Inositol-3-phosphate synthase [Phytophthora palmivora]|uniref:Inositol-3-phosphate synthase n=1 Tax=Phytophthora palmivora TaxID=4796 RepID=A0A2P4XFN0_9STRA|nr:Inositol-3-phosphate synthase [Phytophthora palmivora]
MSLDFVFGLPADDKGNTRILVFVCRLSCTAHLAPVRDKIDAISAPMERLKMKDVPFKWNGDRKTTFVQLRES